MDNESSNTPPITPKDVRTALRNWRKSKNLAQNPLTDLPIVRHRRQEARYGDTPEGRAQALRDILNRAIQELREQAQENNVEDDNWRYYVIVTKQFIEQRKRDAVADELVLAKRWYHTKQKEALEAIALKLQEWNEVHRTSLASGVPLPTSPPDVSHFVGRRNELHELTAQLREQHLAVIVGGPGVGKTDLAAKLVREVAPPDRIFWYSCRPGDGVDSILWALAGFLAHQGQRGPWQSVAQKGGQGGEGMMPLNMRIAFTVQHLVGEGYLLCFDGFQSMDQDQGVQRLLEQLYTLASAPNKQLLLVITSRRVPPFVHREATYQVEGMDKGDVAVLASRRDVTLRGEELDTLYQRTEGYPLFLDLTLTALRRAPHPELILEHLTEEEEIERYLLQEIDRKLTPEQRAVMQAVAVLQSRGGVRDLIEHVLGGGGIRNALRELKTDHLLRSSLEDRGQIYTQHSIVQAYFYDSISLQDRRHMHWQAGRWYEQEDANIALAAYHYMESGEPRQAAELIVKDVWAGINRGEILFLSRLLERFSISQLTPSLWAQVNIARGVVLTELRRNQEAKKAFATALKALERLEDSQPTRELRAKAYRGLAYLARYEPQEALVWVEKGLSQIGSMGSQQEADLYIQRAIARRKTGAVGEAKADLRRSLAILPPWAAYLRMIALNTLGNIELQTGDPKDAQEAYTEALALAEELNHEATRLQILSNLAAYYHVTGDWKTAAELYQQAVDLATRLDSMRENVRVLLNYGVLRLCQGDFEAAQQNLLTVYSSAKDTDLHELLTSSAAYLAQWHLLQKELDPAIKYLQEAETVAQKHGVHYQMPFIYTQWAQVALAQGDPDRALEKAQNALDSARQQQLKEEEGVALRVLGQAQYAKGEAREALESLAASYHLLAENPFPKARTALTWAQILREMGEKERAATLEQEAHTYLQRLGSTLQ